MRRIGVDKKIKTDRDEEKERREEKREWKIWK